MSNTVEITPRHHGVAARLFANLGRIYARKLPVERESFQRPQPPQMYALDAGERSAVLIVGQNRENAGRVADSLRDQGVKILTCKSLECVCSRSWLAHQWRLFKVSHLVVDVDDLGGIAAIYSDLRRIRNTIPDLAVVLISSKFSVDDFSLERLALCDASIRSNCTFAGIEFALSESANVNNKVWQARLTSLNEMCMAT